MRVLISGCGYVGGALGGLLARQGHRVFGLRRSPRTLPPGVVPVAADFTDPGALQRALPDDLDWIFHTASPGSAATDAAGTRDARYRAAYVDGPSNLISALRERGQAPSRLVLTSSTGVYAQRGGEWVDENSPTEAPGPARRMLDGERLWLGGPFDAVVLRLAGIYGPGRAGALDRARHAAPAPADPESPPRYTNRIHRDDCAGALAHLALLDHPELLYLGADHEPATAQTITAWLAQTFPETRAGRPERPGARKSPARTNKRCSNARLTGSGYVFTYPTFREGFAALLGAAGA